jgi:hypothetical protein
MYIFEEYANRIDYEPNFIRHHDAVVFLMHQGNCILDVKRIFFDSQPSKFRVELLFANKPKECFDLDLENYENYINDHFRYKKNSILDFLDIFLFGWNFFIASNDSYLEKILSANINDLCFIFKEEFSSLNDQWQVINNKINNYSYWLAEIINSDETN